MPWKPPRQEGNEEHILLPRLASSSSSESQPDPSLPTSPPKMSRIRIDAPYWLLTMLPLFLQIILSILIGVFVVFYVNHNHFNIISRRPTFTDLDGTTRHVKGYRLQQTDITTILSISLSVLRTFSGSWYAATCWRCAIILMELEGMKLGNFQWMLKTNLPTMFRSPKRTGSFGVVLLAASVLLVALPTQYAAPILTGSISWGPGYYLANATTPIDNIIDSFVASGGHAGSDYDPSQGSDQVAGNWYAYNLNAGVRINVETTALSLGYVGWNDDPRSFGLLKRPFVESDRKGNITVANITLPYFSVDSIEWVTNVNSSLSESQVAGVSPSSGNLNLTSPLNPLVVGGPNSLALMFDTPWPNANPTQAQINGSWVPSVGIPAPTMYNATDGVVAIWAYHLLGLTCDEANSNSTHWSAYGKLPDNIDFLPESNLSGGDWLECFVFAKIKYTAGVTACANCMLQSGNFALNTSDTTLTSSVEVLPDPMVDQALRMIPDMIQLMTTANISVPVLWDSVEDYSLEMIRRAYCASWTALNRVIGGRSGPFVQTTVQITIPSSVASVSLTRVCIWFGVQALSIISGALFILLQSMAKKGLVNDTAMEMFMLDTMDVKDKVDEPGFKHSSLKKRGLLRLYRGDSGDYTSVRYDDPYEL